MNITELEQRIRNFINNGRKQYALLRNAGDWNKLCSSLDLIGDTEFAIKAYPSLCKNADVGSSYLIVYGILQTLLLQQDAAKHIAAVLNVNVKLPKELNNIRILRNGAAGHPGFQNESGQSKSCFISRMSLSSAGFDLMTTYSMDDDYQITHVSIPNLLVTQTTYLGEVLTKVVSELERQEVEHRKMHQETKLVECFPHTLGYVFSKIFESTSGQDKYCLGSTHLGFIKDCLDNFKNKLEDRGEWGVSDVINHHYDQLSYPISELQHYFENKETSKLNGKDAYIFTAFLVEQLKVLKQIAKEIDEEYLSKP